MELEAIGKRLRASSCGSSLAGDRLSSLPDCLIHHIMSFLKARQVVQTCVLSTRWRHLWRSVPCLDIDLEEFKTAGPNRDGEKEWNDFVDFADHLLIPNNISIAHLDTFRLQLPQGYPYLKAKQAAKWIRHGIKYSVQDPGIQRKELNSRSWRLKRLHLCNIHLDADFMKHVSSGCPYLEHMELKDCHCTFHEITSHTLKNLNLKNCSCRGLSAVTSPMLKRLVIDDCQNGSNCQLVIMAPAVAYLLLSVRVWSGSVLLDRMPSLGKASICIRDNNGYISKFGDNQFKLLDSVSNVTSLYLTGFKAMVWPSVFTNTYFPLCSCHDVMVPFSLLNKLYNTLTLQGISEEFPEFQSLRTLSLDECDLSDNFQMLGHFLQHSPNLEKLTLRYCKYSKDPKKKTGKAKLNKRCLNQFEVRCKNLKVTEIIYEDDDVQKLVELLLCISGDLPNNNIKLTKFDLENP